MEDQITKGPLEERVAGIEATLTQMNERLNHLSDDQSIIKMEIVGLRESTDRKITGLSDEIDRKITGLRDKMDSNFKWMIGIFFTSWFTIILAIIFTR